MRISSQGMLVAAVLSLVSGVTNAASQTVNPDTLPKVDCSTLRFSPEFLNKYPKAPSACLEARVYKGQTYMKAKGKVYVAGDEAPISVALEDAYGNSLGTIPVKNPKAVRVIINGKRVDVAHLKVNQELTFWVPESLFAPPAAPAQ